MIPDGAMVSADPVANEMVFVAPNLEPSAGRNEHVGALSGRWCRRVLVAMM